MSKFGGFGGVPNMGKMMKQVQKMQADMAQMQEELKASTIEATAGGGVVKVVMTGEKQIQSLKISPEAVEPDDIEMLEDMIVAAVNEAVRKVDEKTATEMGKITGGMNLPPGLL